LGSAPIKLIASGDINEKPVARAGEAANVDKESSNDGRRIQSSRIDWWMRDSSPSLSRLPLLSIYSVGADIEARPDRFG